MKVLGPPKAAFGFHSRMAEAIRRAERLVAASRGLVQRAAEEQEATAALMRSLLELRGFIQENRQDLLRTLRGTGA